MSATTKAKHARKLTATVERAPHVPRNFHVIDCTFGWQSPLCADRKRAVELYDAHRKRKQDTATS